MDFSTSGFGDEAGATLSEQIAAIKAAHLEGLDVRSIENINVLSLSDDALSQVRTQCENAGIRVQAVGSPINKVVFDEDTKTREIEKLHKAIYAAQKLGTNRIRIFTPELPPHEFQTKGSEVIRLMGEMVDIARQSSMILLHENDGRYFGAFPENSKLMFHELGCENFRAAFDFGNSVMIGVDPQSGWFPWLLPHLDTLHMKDATAEPLQFVACGAGDGKMVEIIRWLIQQNWNGTLTLEPHLKAAGPLGGYSGPELFAYAAERMIQVAQDAKNN